MIIFIIFPSNKKKHIERVYFYFGFTMTMA